MTYVVTLGVNGTMNDTDGHGEPEAQRDPEVRERATRRHYSAAYKMRVLKAIDELPEGEVSAYLRREGIYYSMIQTWRKQREEGGLQALAPKKRGPAKEVDPTAKRLAQLERENQKLQKQLAQAEKIIDVQKKLCDLFGVKSGAEKMRKPR